MRRLLLSADNPLVLAYRERERPTPIVAALFLALLISFVAVEASFWFTYGMLFSGFPSPAREPAFATAALVVELLVDFGTIMLFLWLWLRFFERRSFTTLGLPKVGVSGKALRGALVGVLLMGATVAGMVALGFVTLESGGPGPVGVAALGGVLFVALGYAAQGSAEELLCRGWLLQTAGVRYGVPVGVLFSSLVFALIHLINNAALSVLGFFNLLLAGVFFALYALNEGSLWGVCALHAAYNWSEANLFGFDFYGEEPPGGVLVNLRETGPDVVTGGSVGIGAAGGLLNTVVLLLGLVILLTLARRKASTADGHTTVRVK